MVLHKGFSYTINPLSCNIPTILKQQKPTCALYKVKTRNFSIRIKYLLYLHTTT